MADHEVVIAQVVTGLDEQLSLNRFENGLGVESYGIFLADSDGNCTHRIATVDGPAAAAWDVFTALIPPVRRTLGVFDIGNTC